MPGTPIIRAPSQSTGQLSPVPVGTLGRIVDQHWSWGPNGPLAWSCQLERDPASPHPALIEGNTVEIYVGLGRVWAGRLTTPAPGEPWELTATGRPGEASDFTARPSTTNAAVLSDVIPTAIADGWQVTEAGLPTTPSGITAKRGASIGDVLAVNATALSKDWHVDAGTLALSFYDFPTAPTHLVIADDTPGPKSTDAWANVLVGTYNDVTTGETQYTVSDGASIARHGVKQAPVDLTVLGTITSTLASNILQGMLGRVSYATAWTGSLVLTPGQVRPAPGGAPADLSTLYGPLRFRCLVTHPSPDVSVGAFDAPEFVVGDAEWDDFAQTLTCTSSIGENDNLETMLTVPVDLNGGGLTATGYYLGQ